MSGGTGRGGDSGVGDASAAASSLLVDPRVRWGLFGAVVAVSAFVVVTVFHPLPHTGGDNAGYVALAHGLLTEGSYTDVFDPEGLPHTKYPPVFPALLALLIGAGARTWAALKTTAAVGTVAAVAFTHLWAERRVGSLGAFAVALLTALSVGVVYYSQWVLSDPLFLALTFAALYDLQRADGPEIRVRWLIVGVVAAALAYFTRSAGLPLVLALGGWLAWRRAWRPLTLSAVTLGVPIAAWLFRGRSGGVAQYASEFWMVNPYDPSLGTVGPGGLSGRVAENAVGYLTRHLPLGIVGADAPAVALTGLVLTAAAVVGWALRSRERVGPAELFFPLYWAVILLWPPVWSGDRFALPLLPLIFVYGARSLREITRRIPDPAGPTLATVVVLVLLVPAAHDWRRAVAEASACPEDVVAENVWACYGPRVHSFMVAAIWAGGALPDGAAVLTRKPRHFYLQSGVPSRAFAFFEGPEAHLDLAARLEARYVLLDRWDGFAARYVGAAVRDRPAAFCFVRSFGRPETGAQLLGIRSGAAGPDVAAEVARLERCPADWTTGEEPPPERYSSSDRIPLLEGLDS